jgi:hypothetical protein
MLRKAALLGLVAGMMMLPATTFAQLNKGRDGIAGAGVNPKLQVPMVKLGPKETTRKIKLSETPPPPAPKRLNLDQLMTLLNSLKDVEAKPASGEAPALDVYAYNATFGMSLSSDQSYVWAHGTVAQFENPAQAPVARMLAQMEAGNSPFGTFVYNSQSQQMRLQAPLANQDISASSLDDMLWTYAKTLEITAPLWVQAATATTP